MMALLHSAAVEDFEHRHYDALQSEFDIAIDWSTKRLCVATMDQPNVNRSSGAKCYPRDAPDVKASQFGLQRYGVDFEKFPDIPEVTHASIAADDIYYLRARDGRLQTVILCNAEEMKTVADGPQYHAVAQCQQKFISKPLNALVSINYRRVYLPQWRSIERAWEQLLESFTVEPTRRNASN